VAVGTEHSEVLEPVVSRVSVDVVELERYRLAAPLGSATDLTARGQEPFTDQAAKEPRIADRRAVDEDLLKRSRLEPVGVRLALSPCLPDEMARVEVQSLDVTLMNRCMPPDGV
jgi:hypothetical protein